MALIVIYLVLAAQFESFIHPFIILPSTPLAMATSAGAESRMALGVVIVGGITVSTIVTLFAIPALYLTLAPLTKPAGAIERLLHELENKVPVVQDDAAKLAAKSRPAAAE